jgi:hypothetical protein
VFLKYENKMSALVKGTWVGYEEVTDCGTAKIARQVVTK